MTPLELNPALTRRRVPQAGCLRAPVRSCSLVAGPRIRDAAIFRLAERCIERASER